MRRHILFSILLPALTIAAAAPQLTLTETNGVATTGKITSYFPGTGHVKIRVKNKTVQRSYTSFTEDSRQTIDHWLADKNFTTKSKLTADFQLGSQTLSSNIVGTVTDFSSMEKREDILGTEEREFSFYKITLSNPSKSAFKDIAAEYRIFYTQAISEDLLGKYQMAGTAQKALLQPDAAWILKTDAFLSRLYYQAAPKIDWRGMPPHHFANIEGVWLLLRKKNVEGNWIEREFEFGDVPKKRDRENYQKIYGQPDPSAPLEPAKKKRKHKKKT